MAAEEERLLEVGGAMEDPRRNGADGAVLGLLLPDADREAEAVHGLRKAADGVDLDGEEAAQPLHPDVGERPDRLPVPNPLLLQRRGRGYGVRIPVRGIVGVGEVGAGAPGGEGEAAGTGGGVGFLRGGGTKEGEGSGAAADGVGMVERLAEGLELMEEMGIVGVYFGHVI